MKQPENPLLVDLALRRFGVLMRQTMSRDSAFHENTPSIAAATLNEDRMLSSVPQLHEF